MKTITYNPETHALVPREPSEEMQAAMEAQWEAGSYVDMAKREWGAAIAAAPQPEPVDVEPAMWVMKHIRSGDLTQAEPNQKALHPYMWSDAFPRYTTPQPDRTAELEAALKEARDTIKYYSSVCGEDDQPTPAKETLAKINEVLHD